VLRTLEDAPFAGRTGVGVTVAVLDSGVHSGHPHVGEVRRGTNLTGVGEPANWIDRIGHGTAVAAAIREKSPSIEILAVRVFDRQLATNVAVLADAIVWSADAGAQLINLSLGTSNFAHAERLTDAVAHAAARGALVVSARRSDDVEWLPGHHRFNPREFVLLRFHRPAGWSHISRVLFLVAALSRAQVEPNR